MIEKTVERHPLQDPAARLRDLAYWLSKTAAERIAAVESLRRQHYGTHARIQRVARVTQLAPR
jgi:hypothetical protein